MTIELAKTFDVIYVESIGLRRPEFTKRDIAQLLRRVTRSLGRDKNAARASSPLPSGVHLISPTVLPYHRGPARAVNRPLLRRSVRSWLSRPPAERILWTYSPETYGLETDAAQVIYHCVDLAAEWPRIDRKVVMSGERRLAQIGAIGIGSSPVVCSHLETLGFKDVIHWPNVAEVEPFLAASKPASERVGSVVFGGNLTRTKLDLRHVVAVMQACPAVQIVLAGPVAQGGGSAWRDLEKLAAAGVILPGRLGKRELAALFGTASVGIIPYAMNPYTQGVSPLKTYEYMASGLAVVSTPLPSVESTPPDIYLAESPEEFAERVADVVEITDDDIARRQAMAKAHSWATRGVEARSLLGNVACAAHRGPTNAQQAPQEDL